MKISKVLIVMLVMAFACSMAFASVGVKEEGTMLGAATDINFVGANVTASGAYGGKTVTVTNTAVDEAAATPDTIATSETGTTFVATSDDAGGKSFDLPTITSANDGVSFKFVYAGWNRDSDSTSIPLIIQPQDDAAINYQSAGTLGYTIEADPADAADSYPTIELVAWDGDWYVQSVTGTWAAGS